MTISPLEGIHKPTTLKLDPGFQLCIAEPGDELYPNGIFEFNITRLLAFISAHPERFRVASVQLADIPDYGDSRLDAAAVAAADPSRPILLAEIAPGPYNLIDGHHRVAKGASNGAELHCSLSGAMSRACHLSDIQEGVRDVCRVLEFQAERQCL